MATRFNPAGHRYFDDSANILSGGKLRFKASGSDTLKDTYSDEALTTPNTNPVVLDAYGQPEVDIWLSGSYRVEILDSSDVELFEMDPVGSDASDAPWSDWSSTTSYSIDDVVQGSDGAYYISITNSNSGNDPTSSATNWTQLSLIKDWNTNETYDDKDIVRGTDGFLYSSQAGSNQGNNPLSDFTNWSLATKRPKMGTISVPATTTEISVTGIGFKPSLLVVTGGITGGGVSCISQGQADGSNEYSITTFGDGTNANTSVQSTLWTIKGAAGATAAAGSLTSMDSDGFTIDPTTFSSACTLRYIAFP